MLHTALKTSFLSYMKDTFSLAACLGYRFNCQSFKGFVSVKTSKDITMIFTQHNKYFWFSLMTFFLCSASYNSIKQHQYSIKSSTILTSWWKKVEEQQMSLLGRLPTNIERCFTPVSCLTHEVER